MLFFFWLAPAAYAGGPGPCGVSFNYPDSMPFENFVEQGSAYFSNGVLVLTPPAEGQAGAAWHANGRASLLNGFDTTFSFYLDGTADGIAFVLQPNGFGDLGAGGSGLGYEGIASSLAVEIDTFCFGGEFGCDHISIHTTGDGANTSSDSASLGHAVLPVDVNGTGVHSLRIVYVPGTMAVYFDGNSQPLLMIGVDLMDVMGGTIGEPDSCAYMGFTGGTGAAFALQAITSWSFSDSPEPPEPGCGAEPSFSSFDNPLAFSLVGDAEITNGEIVLTRDEVGQVGAAWYRLGKGQVSDSFTTEFTFVLDGQADGIAFVMQNQGLDALGDGGSGMGYAANGPNGGITNSIAFEIDTFCFGGEFACDHISIQSDGPNENQHGDDFSLLNLTLSTDLNDGLPHTMRIEYSVGSISMSIDGEGIVSGFNLNDLNILDPDGCLIIGFTGGTGGATARQSITSWTFSSKSPSCESALITAFYGPIGGDVGAPGSFSVEVTAEGTEPLAYQWLRDGVPLEDGGNVSGSTSPFLLIDPITTHDSGLYEVIVSNDCGEDQQSIGITVFAACPGDADRNGMVNFADVTSVLANFLMNYLPGSGIGDANVDGIVNFADITNVLANFGAACP